MCDYARNGVDISILSAVKPWKKVIGAPFLSWDFAPAMARMKAAYETGGTSLAKTKAKTLMESGRIFSCR